MLAPVLRCERTASHSESELLREAYAIEVGVELNGYAAPPMLPLSWILEDVRCTA